MTASPATVDFLLLRRPITADVSDALDSDNPDPGGALISAEQERLLAGAIQTLPPRDRILIDLSYRQGLPPEEVASILKTSVGAFYTQKSRILDKIREIVRASGSL